MLLCQLMWCSPKSLQWSLSWISGLVDEFASMLMAAESPEHVSYLNSAFRSLVGAAQEVQQEAEEAQEVHSDAEDTAE